MKIVYVVETYTEGLGYIDNLLPREFSNLGHEVHVLTCGLPPYYMTNEAFFGDLAKDETGEESIKEVDGVELHKHRYGLIGGRLFMKGLIKKLLKISPDVVLVRGISSFVLGQVVYAKCFSKFKLFTSSGQAYSNIPLSLRDSKAWSIDRIKNTITRVIPGRLLSFFVQGCIGSTDDCVDCVVDYYGVPRKKTHKISLGVDTSIFFPVLDKKTSQERMAIRKDLDISEDELLCIWTGRLTSNKMPCLLARAVDELCMSGYKFRALFIGNGPAEGSLKKFSNITVLPFMPWSKLPPYYRAADIAVWPRSITTSTLDASACGLPIILSDQEKATERWRGIGLTYAEGDLSSLKNKLVMFLNNEYRKKLGQSAFLKMKTSFSWESIAKEFLEYFQNYSKINKMKSNYRSGS